METPAIDAIVEIQEILEQFFPQVHVDGDIGRITLAAVKELDEMGDKEAIALKGGTVDEPKRVKASFFAGPQDIAGFKRCKKNGGSDLHCLAEGDNGVGKWGQDCTLTSRNSAALPREVWRAAGKEGGAPLVVTYKGKSVQGYLDDTMPSLGNIENGAGIDLNPGFAVAFGIPVDRMNGYMLEGVEWNWI